jgi:hypothetical protein
MSKISTKKIGGFPATGRLEEIIHVRSTVVNPEQ